MRCFNKKLLPLEERKDEISKICIINSYVKVKGEKVNIKPQRNHIRNVGGIYFRNIKMTLLLDYFNSSNPGRQELYIPITFIALFNNSGFFEIKSIAAVAKSLSPKIAFIIPLLEPLFFARILVKDLVVSGLDFR